MFVGVPTLRLVIFNSKAILKKCCAVTKTLITIPRNMLFYENLMKERCTLYLTLAAWRVKNLSRFDTISFSL